MKSTILFLIFPVLLLNTCTRDTSYAYRLEVFYSLLDNQGIIKSFEKGDLQPVVTYIENKLKSKIKKGVFSKKVELLAKIRPIINQKL